MASLPLKPYQRQTLDALRAFLDDARYRGPQAAFEEAQTRENNRAASSAYQPLPKLPNVPYVCLRLPTGGGKTILAAHAIQTAAAYLERDAPFTLWLVPTNIIRKQTLEALRKPNHPYRHALTQHFGERVLLLDIADFEQLRPQDVRDRAVIVVGTFASLRVKSPEGRRVYAHNENLSGHFDGVRANAEFDLFDLMEEGPDAGTLKFSFRNLLALHRPLVIMDEAHNASSPLSFEVLERVNPGCVVEFTATPDENSNVLHRVTASELKAEDMIKMPIMLTRNPTWQDALQDAVLRRNTLAQAARLEQDFVRPLVLIQAEDKDKEVTVAVVKQHLMDELKIPAAHIAIATGTQRELDEIDLMDSACQIEYVITVEALKEGWDCPFAYVFCSVATVHSKTDVEQLLGRVLRMPYASKRQQPALNYAYANVASTSWPQAIAQLHDRLVNMGFDEIEANQFIQQQPLLNFPQQPLTNTNQPTPLQLVYTQPPNLSGLSPDEQASTRYVATQGVGVILEFSGPVTDELAQKLVAAAPPKDRDAVRKTIAVHRQHQRIAPADQGETITVPQLCLRFEEGEPLELAERELFVPAAGWDLLGYPAALTEGEFAIQEKADSYEIDVMGNRLIERYLGTQATLTLNDARTNWTDLALARWLDKNLRDTSLRQEVTLEFIRRTLTHLVERRKISLTALVRARNPLQKALAEKINGYRRDAHTQGWQATLFGNQAAVQTSYEYAFQFNPVNYPARSFYNGSYQFSNKHLYANVGELKSSGEEFDCAVAIDQNEHVKYWVRNIDSHEQLSFWLPLANGRFYPDFVALLQDKRIMAIEYKGEHLQEYEREKRNIGELWEEKSNGAALFCWAVAKDELGRGVPRQLTDKIAGRL